MFSPWYRVLLVLQHQFHHLQLEPPFVLPLAEVGLREVELKLFVEARVQALAHRLGALSL